MSIYRNAFAVAIQDMVSSLRGGYRITALSGHIDSAARRALIARAVPKMAAPNIARMIQQRQAARRPSRQPSPGVAPGQFRYDLQAPARGGAVGGFGGRAEALTEESAATYGDARMASPTPGFSAATTVAPTVQVARMASPTPGFSAATTVAPTVQVAPQLGGQPLVAAPTPGINPEDLPQTRSEFVEGPQQTGEFWGNVPPLAAADPLVNVRKATTATLDGLPPVDATATLDWRPLVDATATLDGRPPVAATTSDDQVTGGAVGTGDVAKAATATLDGRPLVTARGATATLDGRPLVAATTSDDQVTGGAVGTGGGKKEKSRLRISRY